MQIAFYTELVITKIWPSRMISSWWLVLAIVCCRHGSSYFCKFTFIFTYLNFINDHMVLLVLVLLTTQKEKKTTQKAL